MSSFPQKPFEPFVNHEEYRAKRDAGTSAAAGLRVVIAGIGRNIETFLPRNIERIEETGRMFADYRVVIYENDSEDETERLLREWAERNPKVKTKHETLNTQMFARERNPDRGTALAYCRNQTQDIIRDEFGDFDAVILVDPDLEGGWSYDGLANTFGYWGEFSAVTAYGVQIKVHRGQGRRSRRRRRRGADRPIAPLIYYDAWAARFRGWRARSARVVRRRFAPLVIGHGPIGVASAFGGLGVYRMQTFMAGRYAGGDCEHVPFHKSLRDAGEPQIWLNPSMIVLSCDQEDAVLSAERHWEPHRETGQPFRYPE